MDCRSHFIQWISLVHTPINKKKSHNTLGIPRNDVIGISPWLLQYYDASPIIMSDGNLSPLSYLQMDHLPMNTLRIVTRVDLMDVVFGFWMQIHKKSWCFYLMFVSAEMAGLDITANVCPNPPPPSSSSSSSSSYFCLWVQRWLVWISLPK